VQQEKRGKGSVIGSVVFDNIVENEGEEQNEDPEKGQKKGSGQGRKTGEAIDVFVFVEKRIEQSPAGGNDDNTVIKIQIIQQRPIELIAFDEVFPVEKKKCPREQSGNEIENFVNQRVFPPPLDHGVGRKLKFRR